MKPTRAYLLLLASAFFALPAAAQQGRGETDPLYEDPASASDRPAGAIATTGEDIRRETRERAAERDSTYLRKDEYERAMAQELDEIDARLERLRERAVHNTRADVRQLTDELRQKREVAQARLRDLRSSGEDRWDDLRSRMNAAMYDLRSALQRTDDAL